MKSFFLFCLVAGGKGVGGGGGGGGGGVCLFPGVAGFFWVGLVYFYVLGWGKGGRYNTRCCYHTFISQRRPGEGENRALSFKNLGPRRV